MVEVIFFVLSLSFSAYAEKSQPVPFEIVSSPIFSYKEMPKTILQGKISKNFTGITIVDFWASWCVPCKDSFGFYEKLLKSPRWKNHLRVIAVNLDEEKKIAVDFLKRNKVSFTVIWDGKKKFASKLGVLVLPTAYFVRSNGYFIDRKGFTAKQIPEIEKTLENFDSHPIKKKK